MHYVAFLSIENFRSCRAVSMRISPFTPIVGCNNAGKSNILAAIQWLLSPSKLVEADFWDPAMPVVVEATIEGVDENVLNMLSVANQKKIEPYVASGRISIRRVATSPGLPTSQTTEQVRDPEDDENAGLNAWKPNPGGIWAAIKSMFPEPIRIGAMEDSAEDASRSKTTTTLGRLIAEVTEPIVNDCAEQFDRAIKVVSEQLDAQGSNRPAALADFDRDATASVAEFFPGISVRLHVPTPAINDFLKSGTLRVYEHATQREFESLGHGAQRSIQMALIKLLAERRQAAAPSASTKLLLIDEPELYLHPQAIEQLRDALRALTVTGYQVVFSTHSPIMIEGEDVSSTAMVFKTPANETAIRPTVRSAIESAISDNESQAQLLFSLTNASQVLFADAVLLAEGRTERKLLPVLHRRIIGSPLRSAKIALVGLGGVHGLQKSLAVLNALGLPARAVVDLDYAFRDGRNCGIVDSDDPDVGACLPIIEALRVTHGFSIDRQGLPCKGHPALSPAKVYELLAADPKAVPHIQAIHDKLRTKGIWLWTLGAIEAHLGIEGKNESSWSRYAKRLERDALEEVVTDLPGVTSFIHWAGSLPY